MRSLVYSSLPNSNHAMKSPASCMRTRWVCCARSSVFPGNRGQRESKMRKIRLSSELCSAVLYPPSLVSVLSARHPS
ncbi:hypothetical protein FIBSPDRAFT_213309 [Athelia psychrophila]|uniref:Uncharacterized protein n=1 Tax=Athelia psychrophila TaxID=1759441 RepID=A0A166SBI6_9AGAM|nr:hypothetical protein FIBSPDRAFT_213309 [Fibularhizoctonia sp. CBS 109695]